MCSNLDYHLSRFGQLVSCCNCRASLWAAETAGSCRIVGLGVGLGIVVATAIRDTAGVAAVGADCIAVVVVGITVVPTEADTLAVKFAKTAYHS